MCHFEFEKEADLSSHDPFPPPMKCESGILPACTSRKFTVVTQGEMECRDYQEIKIQEQMHVLGVGSIPRSISVILMEDLVDSLKPGDDVTISGEVRKNPMI
jgi:DNA helicase MCM9